MKQREFKPHQRVRYTGRGFMGYDKSNSEAKFIRYQGDHDSIIEYQGMRLTVFSHEIEDFYKKDKL